MCVCLLSISRTPRWVGRLGTIAVPWSPGRTKYVFWGEGRGGPQIRGRQCDFLHRRRGVERLAEKLRCGTTLFCSASQHATVRYVFIILYTLVVFTPLVIFIYLLNRQQSNKYIFTYRRSSRQLIKHVIC